MHRLRSGRARVAVATAAAPVRCAVYCRKSTEAGLDQAFNSLDNQREAALAYISSQRHENWTALAQEYSDGGFSGGTTDRPSLKRLLADAEAGQLDIIVVYKLDRLSRSLLDFLQLHRFLDERGVQIVSVTEPIDTRTPMGRAFVNVLVSFGQMEREVASERTSHKIRAARRRGHWTGGFVPLGYDLSEGKLTVNKDEAEQVRAIFELYAETPSLVKVAQELTRRGCHTKAWTTKDGKQHTGTPWNRVTLARLLSNPVVAGRIGLGDETFKADHDAIVPKSLFERVQKLMNENRSTGGSGARNRHGALLRGLLRCSACGTAMTHAPVKRGARLHRYYRCIAAQKNGHAACPTKGVKADAVEQFVVDQIRKIGADASLPQATLEQAVAQVTAQRRGLKAEAKRIHRELPVARADVERLVGAVSRTTGSAADAIAAELARAQERLAQLEKRLSEVQAEEAALAKQTVDPADVARALVDFDPIWDVLLLPERERVLRLLIEKIDYDGGTLAIRWRLAGFGELAAEVAP